MKYWDIDAQNHIGFMLTNHAQFQLVKALESGLPILNAASAADIPGLGRYGAINLDVRTPDQLRRIGLTIPRNYQQGTVFDLPFADGEFQTVVLGEFLEHCTYAAAERALRECVRVIRAGGKLVITVPLDGRPNGENRPGHSEGTDENDGPGECGEWSEGVTPHHQTWWSNQMLHDLRVGAGLSEEFRSALLYAFTAPIGGWGMVWNKQ